MVSCFQFGTLTESEIIDFRQTLEPVLIKKAIFLRTKEDLAAMQANIDDCEKEYALCRINMKKHIQFHILIAKACHNKLFVAVMEAIAEIFEEITKNWQVDKDSMRMDLDFNYKFYDCILNRRGDESEKLMKEHFELTKVFWGKDLEKSREELK